MAAFAKRVERETGKWYDPSTLSLLERNQQGWKLVDVSAFAFVDPLKRGRTWLACFDIPEEPTAIVGTIQPDLPTGGKFEPQKPMARKVAEKPAEKAADASRKKK